MYAADILEQQGETILAVNVRNFAKLLPPVLTDREQLTVRTTSRRLAPLKLRAIENERHFRALVKFMDKLVDRIGDQENHPLMGLLDIVTAFVHDYEERNVEIPAAKPSTVLRFLMDQHGLRQADLAGEFGSQSNVSEVLNGKREINARQARSLAKRFHVSPAVFI